jgi:hypothetical protein
MARHDLKTWPAFFAAVLDGSKPFEVRSEKDRRFEVGDVLHLREWSPGSGTYTGRAVEKRVTYVFRGPFQGIPCGVCIMGLSRE